MENVKRILILTFIISATSCMSGQLRINTQPDGADIYISSASMPIKKIGVTPLMQTEDLFASANEPYQMTITKQGFEDAHILIPATAIKRNINLSVKMNELSSNKTQTASELDKVASQVADIQNLIKTKDLTQAERKILIMISQYPNVATFHELIGNVYYLKKDPQNALASYKKANSLAPGNPDTMRMINKLQALSPEQVVNQ